MSVCVALERRVLCYFACGPTRVHKAFIQFFCTYSGYVISNLMYCWSKIGQNCIAHPLKVCPMASSVLLGGKLLVGLLRSPHL